MNFSYSFSFTLILFFYQHPSHFQFHYQCYYICNCQLHYYCCFSIYSLSCKNNCTSLPTPQFLLWTLSLSFSPLLPLFLFTSLSVTINVTISVTAFETVTASVTFIILVLLSLSPHGRIQEFLKGEGGLYTIVVSFNANGVEGVTALWPWRELLRGPEPCSSFPPPPPAQKEGFRFFPLKRHLQKERRCEGMILNLEFILFLSKKPKNRSA